jgi:DNA-binding NarL/FixJ family response regulator
MPMKNQEREVIEVTPMQASAWMADSQFADHSEEGTVTFLRRNPGPVTAGAEASVMIAYADPVVAAGLAAVLGEHGGFQIIPTAEPGDLLSGPAPADVVLADYETALRLTECAPQWANNVVIFTNYDSEAKICRALESGARGYLLYGVGLPELFGSIHSVRAGGLALSPLVVARITNRVTGEALTEREKSVLEQLMLGLSNKAIARRLNVCLGTVKTHVKSILEKLNANSRTAAVMTAQRRGLLP